MNNNLLKIEFETGEIFYVNEGTTVNSLIKKISNKPHNILAVMINNEQHSVFYELVRDSYCKFVTYSNSQEGERIYTRTLKFILYMAMQQVDPTIKIKFLNKLDGNHYAVIKSGNINQKVLNEIKSKMNEIIASDYKFRKVKVNYDKAKRIYETSNQFDKLDNIFHKLRGTYTIYECNNYNNYFYGSLSQSTGDIFGYDLKLYKNGLLLMLPSKDNINIVNTNVKQNRLHDIFIESNLHYERIDCDTVAKLNKLIKEDKISEVIQFSESIHNKNLVKIAENIVKSGKVKVVLIAGPSSSGKTTFSRRLAIQLKTEGYNSIPISMDDFFLEREETPIINGKRNFENIDAIDLDLYQKVLLDLLDKKETVIPRFDFKLGKKIYDRKPIKMKENDILIIEGIHGLNPKSSNFIDDQNKYKIYIAPLTTLNMDNWNKFSSSDMRKIRRMVRDNRDRKLDSKKTLSMWKDVTEGEKNNIFPFVEDADFIFNSSLIYELIAIAPLAKKLLLLEVEDEHYAEAWRLFKILDSFLSIDNNLIPNNSIIREFLGGSAIEI